MKKISFALLFASAFLFSGCHKLIDWTPINLLIEVVDSEGNNLATPENRAVLEGTTKELNGKEATLQLDYYPTTKDCAPSYSNEFFIEKEHPFENCLEYGEFDGSSKYVDAPFKITWPDGSTDVITYSRKLNRVTVNAREVWKLNGEKCDNPVVFRKDFKIKH